MNSSSNWSKNEVGALTQWDGEAATLCYTGLFIHHANLAGTRLHTYILLLGFRPDSGRFCDIKIIPRDFRDKK